MVGITSDRAPTTGLELQPLAIFMQCIFENALRGRVTPHGE